MRDEGKPAAYVTLKMAFDGLDEIGAKVDELADCLSRAQDLIDELSGEHDLDMRLVQISEPYADPDDQAAFRAGVRFSADLDGAAATGAS